MTDENDNTEPHAGEVSLPADRSSSPALTAPDTAQTGAFAPSEPSVAAPAPAARKRRTGVFIGVGVGVAAIAGGAAFAVTQLGGPKSNTPEQAVQGMLESVSKGDVIGMMEALAPGERDAMLDSVVPLVDQLRRLDVFDNKLDLKKVEGLEGSLTGYVAKSTKLRSDLAAVRVTAGTLVTRFDPKKLPFGRLIRDNAGKQIDKTAASRTVTKLHMKDTDDPVVVVKDGNRWYISIGYNIAEAARRKSGSPGEFNFAMPAKGAGVPAKGAATPEAAVEQFINAASALDARRVLELMPPDELAAAHDYAGQFIGKAEDGVKKAKGKYELSFPGLKLATKRNGDNATVTIVTTGVDFALTDPSAPVFRAKYAGRCVTLTLDTDTKKRCGKDIAKLLEDFGVPVDAKSIEKSLNRSSTQTGKRPTVGFTVIKRNGAWYVSPTRTMLDAMTATLKIISKDDLNKIEKQIKDTVSAVQNGGSTTATTVDPSLGDPTFNPGTDAVPDTIPVDTTATDTAAADTTTDLFAPGTTTPS